MNSLTLFSHARLKLTLYYILIFLTISSVISGLFYYRTSQVLKAEYDRLERRLQLELRGMQWPMGQRLIIRQIQTEDLEIAKQQIIFQLLRINGLIVVLVAISGYVLSGLTLAPIEASMKQQKRFISDIAHEIKTPLTSLKTSLEVNLMDKKLPASTKTLLKENLEDVSHLDNLTTSMLKLSKNNDEPLNTASVAVSQIIDQAVRITRTQAKKKKIKVVVKPVSVSAVITGDRAALTDAVKILLDNAIKYSDQSTTVTIFTAVHQHAVRIKVQDQGIGINKMDIDHVFDRFYRVDSSRSNNQESGYGLGLSIAKTIVKYHNGSIAVKSKLGLGTTFTLTFPRA